MRSKTPALCLILATLAASVSAHAEGDPERGRLKAETCLGCHGIDSYKNVYPTYHVPKLGGQKAEYLVTALAAYANGERPHITMHAQSSTLSPADIEDIAAFFASQSD